jgi:hypothetical protein
VLILVVLGALGLSGGRPTPAGRWDAPAGPVAPAGAFGLHDTPVLGGSRDLDRAFADWRAWEVRWVTVLNPRTELLRRARAEGIGVIARVWSPAPGDPGDLVTITRRMVALGQRYVVPYNEPNLRAEWGSEPDPEVFAGRWLTAADTILALGGTPVLTPLAPNGDYPEDLFFARFLAAVVAARGPAWLIEHRVALGLHVYLQETADEALPYIRRYTDHVRAHLGHDLPVLVTEGGFWLPSGSPPARYHLAVQRTAALATAVRQGRLPVQALTFWLYSNLAQGGHDARWERAVWFTSSGPTPLAVAARPEIALATEEPAGE